LHINIFNLGNSIISQSINESFSWFIWVAFEIATFMSQSAKFLSVCLIIFFVMALLFVVVRIVSLHQKRISKIDKNIVRREPKFDEL
jgi:NADH:ubiquinone oxidoreductase subunit 6 (subunit J)